MRTGQRNTVAGATDPIDPVGYRVARSEGPLKLVAPASSTGACVLESSSHSQRTRPHSPRRSPSHSATLPPASQPPTPHLTIRPDALRGAGDELAALQRGPKRLNELRNHPLSEDHRQHSDQRVLRRPTNPGIGIRDEGTTRLRGATAPCRSRRVSRSPALAPLRRPDGPRPSAFVRPRSLVAERKGATRHTRRPAATLPRGRRGHPGLQAPLLGAADRKRRNCPGIPGVRSEVPEAHMSAAWQTLAPSPTRQPPGAALLWAERRPLPHQHHRRRRRAADPGLYKHSKAKQYLKGGALRTETTINDPNDFGVGRAACGATPHPPRPLNPALRADRPRPADRRLLHEDLHPHPHPLPHRTRPHPPRRHRPTIPTRTRMASLREALDQRITDIALKPT